MRRTVTAATALGLVVTLSGVIATVHAANWPDPRLDAAATSVAGHPVTVFCENDPAAWSSPGGAYTWPPNYSDPTKPYYKPPELLNIIWMGPAFCPSLHSVFERQAKSPLEDLVKYADSIFALVHEAVHQRGGVYGDCWLPPDHLNDGSCEGRTDCLALSLSEDVAINFFGFPRTVSEATLVPKTKTVYRYVRKKVRGKWKRVRVQRKITVYVKTVTQVRNPVLDKMRGIQRINHQIRATGNPWYKGDC